MTLSNLPPGVCDSMIPGNSRDDQLCIEICDDCGKDAEDRCKYWMDFSACPQIEGRHDDPRGRSA